MTLYCQHCQEPHVLKQAHGIPRRWIEPSDVCGHCGGKDWTTVNEPRRPWILTDNDKTWMRKRGLGPD